MRSWIGYLSPYVRSLEERVEKNEFEKSKLLDRILHLTTGAPLEIPKTDEKQDVAPSKPIRGALAEAAAASEELNSLPTYDQLLRNMESESFREDAGLEPETQIAAIARSEEEMSEEQKKGVDVLKKQFKENFLRAREEYLKGAQVVYTESEKRAAKAN